MKRPVSIVAIDVVTKQEAADLSDKLMVKPQPTVKTGMELYYGLGQAIAKEAKKWGFKVFLDLKLYDIPNTVHRVMAAIGRLGVDFTTIHAAGGSEMLITGLAGLEEEAKETGVEPAKLLAITQLTSTGEKVPYEQQHVDLSLVESVQSYARLAEKVGLTDVVCSAHEIKVIREVMRDDSLCVTPGTRPTHAIKDDQK